MEDIFDKAVKKIEIAYEELGHEWGWRFLHTPKKTLDPSTELMFIGINPGGGGSSVPLSSLHHDPEFIRESCEKGNAFRIENWGATGHRHQEEVQKMFMYLSSRLGPGYGTSWEDLMNTTLTSNFCPFRSPGGSWNDWGKKEKNEAIRKEEATRFSYELWSGILPYLEPKVIICDGNGKDSAFYHFTELFKRRNFKVSLSDDPRSDVDRVKVKSNYLCNSSNKFVNIIGLPHLASAHYYGRIFAYAHYDGGTFIPPDKHTDAIEYFLDEVELNLVN